MLMGVILLSWPGYIPFVEPLIGFLGRKQRHKEGGGGRTTSEGERDDRAAEEANVRAEMQQFQASTLLYKTIDWWYTLNESKAWQNRFYYSLAGAYALIAIVALIQLIRIEVRVPEYGWTTQKVFHLLNFLVNGVRAVVFLFRRQVQFLKVRILQTFLLDLPGLLFFTTYTLLVLFWAEIYHQARSLPTDNLRPMFLVINAIIYLIQILVWLIVWWKPIGFFESFSKIFFAGVSFVAAMGFLLYGGRLFLMLQRFPIESKGRRKKLREVGFVTAICFTCFTIRSAIMAWAAFDKRADLDVVDHPVLNAVGYLLVEILPSALVLYILRKLPPKRPGGGYEPIRPSSSA